MEVAGVAEGSQNCHGKKQLKLEKIHTGAPFLEACRGEPGLGKKAKASKSQGGSRSAGAISSKHVERRPGASHPNSVPLWKITNKARGRILAKQKT